MYRYDAEFYRYINQGASNSAERVLQCITEVLDVPVRSVLDVGCGAGAWLAQWKTRGAEVLGIDGDYVRRDQLLVEPGEFRPVDLRGGFRLERRFDLAQCLEVAEHLPAAAAATLVDSLCEHADIVLFSAAPPGQGGENHINEQPYRYWRDLFDSHGYQMYDPVRPALLRDRRVMPWYRYNCFLFLRRDSAEDLHARLAPWRVDPAEEPRDLSPRLYRLRKWLVRLLPPRWATRVAMWKKNLFNSLKKARA